MTDRVLRSAVGPSFLVALLATAGWCETPPQSKSAGSSSSAQRLCDVLHTVPAKRKGECCGTTTTAGLTEACTQEVSAVLATGSATIDAAAVDRCAAEQARQLEGCDWVNPLMPPLPDACRGLVRGQLKAGARCRSSLACVDGLYCKGLTPNTEGVCTAPGAARTRCEVPTDNLAAFTRARDDRRHPVCDGLCVKGQCLPFAPAGGACVAAAGCAPGLHCISGRCQDRPLPKAGEACVSRTSCASGSFCQAGQCVALKGEGASCALPFECRGLVCEKAPGAKLGKCGPVCGSVSAGSMPSNQSSTP
jgi:hypothetical protein